MKSYRWAVRGWLWNSAVSADHLLHASDADIRAMADKGVVATLPSYRLCPERAVCRGREMIDAGCAVALATDLNPAVVSPVLSR